MYSVPVLRSLQVVYAQLTMIHDSVLARSTEYAPPYSTYIHMYGVPQTIIIKAILKKPMFATAAAAACVRWGPDVRHDSGTEYVQGAKTVVSFEPVEVMRADAVSC